MCSLLSSPSLFRIIIGMRLPNIACGQPAAVTRHQSLVEDVVVVVHEIAFPWICPFRAARASDWFDANLPEDFIDRARGLFYLQLAIDAPTAQSVFFYHPFFFCHNTFFFCHKNFYLQLAIDAPIVQSVFFYPLLFFNFFLIFFFYLSAACH
eukprot:Tamp_29975.p1 GENE.Tamp_29975~~Tamp_29975.p1  ORF type:complete len:152 (+),score=9.84 Tamp_29975:102-557(+)